MFDPLAGLLAFYFSLTHSYVFAIAMLTLTVMIVLAPLTVKSTRSMLALQRLQPEIKKLQNQHKGDRQALNEAMMAFYKEHSINPLGGCLPMLLQMPVFIIMYRVIHGLVDGHGPKYIKHSSDLYKAIQHDGFGHMKEFGIDLARSASNVGGGLGHAWPYYLMVGLVVATGFYQARQMTSRQSAQAAQANAQAQMMQKIFPVLFGFISLNIPAGVVVYFIVSNLFRVAQQGLMYKFDPQLKTAIDKEVREVEAKAVELKKPARNGQREVPKETAGNGQGAAQRRGQQNRSRSKKRRKGR
ncbi:MAG: YidC/Oxa1 family rane protein insertase [Actinomycetota bacterium]|jgi:YidC/Oxa1 family membrane protein insertase